MAADAPAALEPTRGGAEYVVVARRYRPQNFAELVGQQQVSQALSNALATGRVGHAYLFCGARGTGKTSTARIFAKCLNCEQGPTSTPCGVCDLCQGITAGSDVDVLEIDGASNRGIDEIRELRANVNIRPSRARFKVYIIDEVHMFTKEAFNALLKTLEEPPEHVKFILCTTDPEKLPITVLSRCQRFDFTPVETRSIQDRLRYICEQEGVTADAEALHLLARRANGSLRDSQSLLEQILAFGGQRITVDDVHSLLGTVRGGRLAKFMSLVLARDTAAALTELDQAVGEGVDAGQFTEQLLGYLRDMMAAAVGCPPELLLHNMESDYAELKQAAETWGVETLLAATQIVDQTLVRMRQSTHSRTLLEIGIVRLCQLQNLSDLAAIISQLRTGAPLGSIAIERKAVDSKALEGPAAESKKKSEPAGGVAAPVAPPVAIPSAAAVTRESALREPATVPSIATVIAPAARTEEEAVEEAVEDAAEAPIEQAAVAGDDQQEAPGGDDERPPFDESEYDPAHDSSFDDASFEPAVAARETPIGRDPAPARGGPATSTGNQAAAVAEEPPANVLTPPMVRGVWQQVVERLEGLTQDYASNCSSLAIVGPNKLAVRFSRRYNAARSLLEHPDRRAEIERHLAEICGAPIRVEFGLLEGEPEATAVAPARTFQQLRRETMTHPFVARAIEMFDAEVLRVHEGGN